MTGNSLQATTLSKQGDIVSPYVAYLSHLDNEQKESIFLGFLIRLMAIHNYRLRTQSPDTGQDAVVANRKRPNVVYPAQLKSCYGIWHLHQGRTMRYLTNIRASRLEGSFGTRFLYFFGLYIPHSDPPDFHLGCVPSSFFEAHWKFLQEKKLQKSQRVNIEIDFLVHDDRFFMFMYPLVEVTQYFKSFDAIS